jgi:chitinase
MKLTFCPDRMVQQITWDDQWMTYDDQQSITAKLGWANTMCIGGSFVSSQPS